MANGARPAGFLRLFLRGRRWALRLHPSRRLFAGYLVWVLLGWAVLSLPLSQAEPLRAFDTFYIATATVSTGGIMPYDVGGGLTVWGELTLLVLLQVGGLGYMTLGSFAYLAISDRLSSLTASSVRAGFGLGDAIDLRLFVRSVALFTLACEAVGTLVLWWAFARAGVPDPLWQGLFHAVSAFCTAGISLFPTGLEPFRADVAVNAAVVVLTVLGALGFLVVVELWRYARGQSERIGFSTAVVLRVFPALILGGALLLAMTEPVFTDLPPAERFMAALFQAAQASTTAGFNTVPIGTVGSAAALLLMGLMFIGAAPAGTGGGFKVTSFAALWGLMHDTIMQRRRCTIFGRRVSDERLHLAAASLAAYLAMGSIAAFTLAMLAPDAELGRIGFEVVAALTNGGLSQGLTAELGDAGRAVIAAAMFAGRLGVLSFGLALGFRGGEQVGVDEDLVL